MIHLPRFAGARRMIHRAFENNGWLVRRMQGFPAGVDLIWDIEKRLQMPLQTIVDIGAHKGETIQYFHGRLDDCRILAFEPIYSTFQTLDRSWGRAENVKLRHMALADQSGSLTICLNTDSQANSLNRLPTRVDSSPGETYEKVRVSTLDAEVSFLCEEKPIDLVKIDVEGVELRVLQGANNILRKGGIRLILSEFTLNPADSQHTHLDELRSVLDIYGFCLVGFYDQVIWNSPPRLGYGNALFALSPEF